MERLIWISHSLYGLRAFSYRLDTNFQGAYGRGWAGLRRKAGGYINVYYGFCWEFHGAFG